MELVDVLDSKSCEGNLVPVRPRPSADYLKRLLQESFLFRHEVLSCCFYFAPVGFGLTSCNPTSLILCEVSCSSLPSQSQHRHFTSAHAFFDSGHRQIFKGLRKKSFFSTQNWHEVYRILLKYTTSILFII